MSLLFRTCLAPLEKAKVSAPANRSRQITKKTRKALTTLSRCYTSSSYQSPILLKEKGSSKLANVGRVKPDGTTGRFFKKATVIQVPTGWEVEVDGYCITSKEGRRIVFPSEELAVATAADWEYMHKRVDPRRMPLYTLASLATDLEKHTRDMHRETIKLVFEDDILGPRNETPTPHLENLWLTYHDPVIGWFQREYEVDFTVDNTMTTKQSRRASRAMMRGVNALDDWALMGLVTSVDTTLSLVLSLGLWNGEITVEEAAAASRAEYVIQEASWGDIPGHTDIRRLNYLMDLHSSTLFLHCLPCPVFSGSWLKTRPTIVPLPDSKTKPVAL